MGRIPEIPAASIDHHRKWNLSSATWAGPDPGWVATVLDRRYGWHVAEQAALEVDRIVRLGKPVRSPELSPTTLPVPTYATDGTGACAAKPASPCTGHVESNSTPEPKNPR